MPFAFRNSVVRFPEVDASPAGSTAAAAAPEAPKSAPAVTGGGEHDVSWLKPRLEQAKASVLKELGVDNIDDAKKAFAELKAKQDAAKSDAEKAADFRTKFEAQQAENKKLADAVAEYAGRQMLGLSAEQQAAVKAIAGDDAAQQIKAITALSPTWAAKRDAEPLATSGTAVAPAFVPVTTAPAPSAPSGTVTSPPDHRAVYVELRASNPFAAAAYAEAHPEAYAAKG